MRRTSEIVSLTNTKSLATISERLPNIRNRIMTIGRWTRLTANRMTRCSSYKLNNKGPSHESKVVHVDRHKPFRGDYDPSWWTERLEIDLAPSVPQDNLTIMNQAITRPTRRRLAPPKLGEWST